MVRIGGPAVARPGSLWAPQGLGHAAGAKTLSYRSSMLSLMRYHESLYVREQKRFTVYPKSDYVTGDVDQLQDDSGVEQLTGVRTLRKFEDMLENAYHTHLFAVVCCLMLPLDTSFGAAISNEASVITCCRLSVPISWAPPIGRGRGRR